MTYQESWLSRNWFMLILPIAFAILIGGLFWFSYEMKDPNGDVQQALSKEQNHLDSIKSDCKALGNYILDNKGSLLDPVIREARDLYMVNCK